MPRARILVVDDAVTVRRAVGELIASDPDLELVATAPNGKLALEKFAQLRPDLVVLDLEMPEMGGLAALAILRERGEKVPVLILSQYVRHGSTASLEALARGADDCIAKPDSRTQGAYEAFRPQFLEKVRGLLKLGRTAARPAGRPGDRSPIRAKVEAVVVGVSTGGPNALAEVLPALPGSLPVPVLVVQHMLPMFSRSLAQRLAPGCKLALKEAVDGEAAQPGVIYLAPGECHLEVRKTATGAKIALTHGPPENSCRPSVDVLFRSAVEVYGAGVLAVVLTGMGRDGMRGCELIREAGGAVVIQDEASSVVWGMPGAVSRAGLACATLPLNQIAAEIEMRARFGRSLSTTIG
jgi:two-component system, chemotaxis family, protein-glutamate methylesterase/glutaminase